MNKPIIMHLQTGGTITGNVPEYKELENIAHIFLDYVDIGKYIVYSMQADCEYKFTKICDKDSREIMDLDRQRLVDEIMKGYEQGIKLFLITHGTYTLPETGIYIMNNMPADILKDVSVVLTGAMYPWGVLGTDAPMNVGASVSSLLNMSGLGVKVCMHGRNWDPDKIEKDAEKLLFHAKIVSNK